MSNTLGQRKYSAREFQHHAMDFEPFENFVTGTHTQFEVVMDFKVRYSEASYKLEVGSGITASFN